MAATSASQRGLELQLAPSTATFNGLVPQATIEEVLRPVFVRRRRKDIRELYGTDIEISGKPVRFPEPVLDNLFYQLDKVYARAGKFADLQARLQRHRGARYLALDYLRPAARERPQYRDLLRARNRVAALMRALLFKRLESSVAAFRATLDTLSRSNRHFRAALDGGIVPIGRTATGLLAGETFDLHELLERLEQEEQRRQAVDAPRARLVHPVEDFDIARWQADLDADYAILESLRANVAAISPEDDDKLRALKQFLVRPEVAAGRVLIFSEAAATVEYLFDQLNPGGDDPAIARLSGANMQQLQQVVKRFAPAANLGEGEPLPGPPVRILITTDVVSEGQNLQDCNRVLNYDLHWNPVRLIQRFGRVDRIGTTYEQIFLHNTWPDTDVDAGLSLTERLQRRIQSFHDFIGLDTPLLSADERLNPNAMYRIYEQKQLPERDDVLDEVAAFQRGVALLQRIQQDDPDLWKAVTTLPDGIRSALPARTAPEPRSIVDYQVALPGLEVQQPLMTLEAAPAPALPPSLLDAPRPGETIALFKHGERPAAYAVGSELNARAVSLGQLLAAVECLPETPAAPLPADTNARVMAAYEAMRRDTTGRLGRSRRPSGDSRLRRYLARELRALRTLERDADELRRISILQQVFTDYLPSNVVADLEDVRRVDLRGEDLIRRLEALRERHRLQPAQEDADASSPAVEVVRTVCSDGLAR